MLSMLRGLRTLFSPPVFPEDEDKTRRARYSYVIALGFLGLALFYEMFLRVFGGYAAFGGFDLILFGIAFLCVIGLYLLHRGYVRFTSFVLVAMVWLASNGLALTGFGARDASYLVNFAIVLMAGLLLGWQASLVVTLASILSGVALAFAEQNQLIGTIAYDISAFTRDIAFVFLINGLLIYLLIRGMEAALKRSRQNLVQLESANADLKSAQNELQRRSSELLDANQQLERRTRKLQAIAMITRAAASIQSFESLVTTIPGAIKKQLGYAHARLFLLDEKKEFVILRSTSAGIGVSDGDYSYRLPIKQTGAIAFVLQTGHPRILQPRERDTAFMQNIEPAISQSELLLPLKAGEQLMGLLDIHSSEAGDFSENDISELSVLADQLAITLQNLVLYEQSRNALRTADMSSTRTSMEAWSVYKKAIGTKGYRYDGIRSEPLKPTKQMGNEASSLAVPIELRGHTIGSFKLNPSDPSRAWTDDELAMVRATAERVALALEGTRLLEEAQKRAAREAFLSDIATKLSASFQLDSILRDTVQELGQTLRNSTVTFQLVNPNELGLAEEPGANGRSTHNKSSGADDE